MTTWVYFEGTNEAVELAEYRRNDDLQKRKVAFTLDDATGKKTVGKPEAPRTAAKSDEKKDEP